MKKQQEAENKLNKEKLFPGKKPRSRVQLDIVNRIKSALEKMPSELPAKIISYQKVIREEGEYYLLYQGSDELKPLFQYLANNSIELKKLLKEFRDILKTLRDFELIQNLFPEGINAGNFWIDDQENIFLMPEEFLKAKKNYNSLNLELPAKEFFRAPEIINGEKWQPESYIFNTGAVFYYFLSSKTIFNDQDNAKILNKIQNEKILELKKIFPELKTEVNDLIMKMLAKSKSERPDLESVIKELAEIASETEFELKAFSKRRNTIDQKIVKRKNRKENFKLFFRLNWKTILFFSILTVSLIWGAASGPDSLITSETRAEEVVNYFYGAVAAKNIQLAEESADFDLGNMERLISETHVIEKMQEAYSGPEGNEGRNQIYTLANLKIEQISSSTELKIFAAVYDFSFREENGEYRVNLKDKVFVEKRDSLWQITEIEGDMKSLINGEYPWRDE